MTRGRVRLLETLPEFPWDSLVEFKALAQQHPDGIVDLSVGTPVDEVAPAIREALAAVAELAGYPATHGTPQLRAAIVDALRRRHGIVGVPTEAVLPTIGSKELVAWLPRLLGLGPNDTVAIPELAYPTYEIGALLAGATPIRTDEPWILDSPPAMVWLNSPANPTGRVLPVDHLRKIVAWAQERDVIVVSDECYASLGWDAQPVSLLHPQVHGGRMGGLLAVHSLSKSANLASYRAGFVAGDPEIVSELLAIRKHAGMIVPRPIQEAMTAALVDDEPLTAQHGRYQHRRALLKETFERNGFRVDHSEAGLYLWATRGEDTWSTVEWLARRGILVAPGVFYGPAGAHHVRIALTATDERINAAATRLTPTD